MVHPDISTGHAANIWLRGILRLLFSVLVLFIWMLTGVVAIMQFIVVLLNKAPNERLIAFGRSLAMYTRQIVGFLTFAAEEVPFPFSDWPTGG